MLASLSLKLFFIIGLELFGRGWDELGWWV
jgi:hypothetical protein